MARLVGAILGSAVLVAACAPASAPPSFAPSITGQLITQVVAQANDVGIGPSAALDSSGNPVVTSILATAVLKAGSLPPQIVPGQPQPPAVVLADRTKATWNTTSVTPQKLSPAEGTAPELVDSNGHALPGVSTSLAIDGQGKDHVVWSTPSGLFYADDTGGAFGTPVQVTKDQAFEGSIAVASDGTVWVSFYSGTTVKVAQRTGGSWKTQDVAHPGGAPGLPAVVTAIRVTQGGPVVAYGDNGSTVVATPPRGTVKPGTAWSTTTIAGSGGYGVSMALDKDGNPIVTYYDAQGTIHFAQLAGGSWSVTDLGTTAPGPNSQGNRSWSTSIAIDDQGVHYIAWADTKASQIVLDTDRGGSFKAETVSGGQAGANPTLAVSGDGKSLALAWYDTDNQNLDVATAPPGGLTLAFTTPPLAPPSITAQPTSSGGAPPCSPQGSGTPLNIVAKNIAFDVNCLATFAGKAFDIDFNNQDAGTPHNVEIYTTNPTSGGTRLGGATGPSDIITGPATTTYKVNPLKAGSYYFQCDIHPTTMFGTFVAASK